MGTQTEAPPDGTHGGLTKARPRCQRATAPMRGSLGSLFQGEAYGPLDTVIADLPWRSRPHLVTQTNHPLGHQTIPPHAHSETGGEQLGGHRVVALPAGTLLNDARATGQRSRTPRLLQQLPQSDLRFWADNEFSLLRTSSWIRHNPR